jgi:hypothetical protein
LTAKIHYSKRGKKKCVKKFHKVFRISGTVSDFATASPGPPDLDIYQGYDDFAIQTSRKKQRKLAKLTSSSVPWSREALPPTLNPQTPDITQALAGTYQQFRDEK